MVNSHSAEEPSIQPRQGPTDRNQQISHPHSTENQPMSLTAPPVPLRNSSVSTDHERVDISMVPTSSAQQKLNLFCSVPLLDTNASPQQSQASILSPPVLEHHTSTAALKFLRSSANRVNALRRIMLAPSVGTTTERSNRSVANYAKSRGSDNAQGMESVNSECIRHGEVWRMAAVFVRGKLLDITQYNPQDPASEVAPYMALPSVMQPKCTIVWRDIYDAMSAKTDKLSIQTRIEVAAAGRTAYNWLNKRHRTVISEDVEGYVQTVLDVICSGIPRQHKSCAINAMKMCYTIPNDIKPIAKVSTLLADWIIFEHLEEAELKNSKPNKPSIALLDHYNQVAMFHVRGQWGGDLIIEGETRRRSEILNYVTHSAVVLAHDEIRTCPCLAEEIITSMVATRATSKDVFTSDEALREPGLVKYRRSRFILIFYIVLLSAVAVVVIRLCVSATADAFLKIVGALTGWSWSLALVSAFHFIVIKNLLPGTTLRHLGQGKRQASDLTDMKLKDGALIMLAHDARTNHLLAPGNACAYANRPSGKVQVSKMPSAREAWNLGLVITDKFAIKLQQNTLLIRRTVENLDGSIHIEWDEAVQCSAVGRLLDDEVKVG